jgi:hypothetical protein
MAFSLERDAGGVPGLHVCKELFSVAFKRRVWARLGAPPPADAYHPVSGRCKEVEFIGPDTFPAELFQLINACRDCGLAEELVSPDYAACLAYTPGAVLLKQFDSRYRWGEVRSLRHRRPLPADHRHRGVCVCTCGGAARRSFS